MSKIKTIFLTGVLVFSMAFMSACAGKTGDQQEAAVEETAPAAEEVTEEVTEEPEESEAVAEVQEDTAETTQAILPDGTYDAEFSTDSSMFHVSEACDGKGVLTVENGQMTIHVSLASRKILNLYPGSAEDAQKDGAQLLEPTVDEVTYSDGLTDEVYGFDIPVPALDEEFDVALIGTKGKWYDHKVCVSNPVDISEAETAGTSASGEASGKSGIPDLADGSYLVEMTFEGGSGRARIASPVTITVENQKVTASVEWSSPNYDYMLVDGEKFLPVNTEGNSVFEIPVAVFDEPVTVIGDTVAMSKPHEIEYTLTFHSDTIKALD